MDTVFLSGLGQTPGVWDGVRRCLPELKDVRCPSLSGGTYPALYDALEADCQALEAPFRLCGLSLGAVLALDYAARNPHHVASLVLIAPRYRMPRRLLEIQDRIFALLPERAFRESGRSREEMRALAASLGKLDLSPCLGNIACPTRILCGQRDIWNRGGARRLAALLPDAAWEIVPGAGHEVNRDAPEALAARLRAFWTEK